MGRSKEGEARGERQGGRQGGRGKGGEAREAREREEVGR